MTRITNTISTKFILCFVFLALIVSTAYSQAPTVNSPTATGITTTDATLGGTVTGSLTHIGTRWSTTSPVGTSNELEEASTTAGAFTQVRTGLPSASRIFFIAYARNNADAGTTSETLFVTEPLQLSGGQLTVTATGSTTIDLAFPAANSWVGTGATAGYVIYRNIGSAPSLGALADGAAPPTNGTGNKIATITDGTATTFSEAGLTPASNYYYTIVPFAWDGSDATTYNYNLASPQTANDFTFAAQPSGHATGAITVTPVSSSQLNLGFNSVTTSGITNATGYIVLIKSSAIVVGDLATLEDGAAPNAFGLFEAIINSTGTGTYSDLSGLSPNTTYHYAIIPYNRVGDDETYNYLTTAGFAIGSGTTSDISATFTVISGGTAPVPASTVLSAGVNLQVIAGFSVTSDGTQEINDINFNYSGLASQFTTEYLYRSTTAGTIGSELLSDGTPDGNFSMTSVSVPDKTINSTPIYYYLVTDVSDAVTQASPSVTVAPTQANITVASGTVNSFSLNRTVTFNTSQLSDIVFANDGTTPSIAYRSFQGTSIGPNNAGSETLGDFIIRDGGGASDPDNRSTSVSSITIQVTNFANIRQIALFDDDNDQEINGTEQTVTGSTITFTPSSPIVALDNQTFRINIRASFRAVVTDKQTLQITITGVTANSSGSGFAAANAGGAVTAPAGTNAIAVNASKLVFASNPPATAINQPFSLTVRAVDSNPYNNTDLDYTGQIGLTKLPAAGSLTAGAQSLTPNLVAGQFIWTDLRISAAGAFTLEASDDTFADAIGDASGSVNITSSPSTITQPPALNLCYGGIFQNLGNIVITESDPAGFSSSGSFSIGLPTGFIFDTSVTTAPVISNGTASPTTLSYTGENIVQFSYNFTAGSSNTNSITISGLRIRYPGNTTPSGGNSITRVGGTAVIAGVIEGTTLGTANAALGTPPVGGVSFAVNELPGNVEVEPDETRFSVGSNPVSLIGSPSGGVFSGSGVTFTSGEYRFNPSSLSPGDYDITYTYQFGVQQCQFIATKTFTVYTTNINGLNLQYCTNSPQTGALSVDETYIDSRFFEALPLPGSANFNFLKFIYYDPSFGPRDIISPAPNIFDPKLPAYQSIYSLTETYYGTFGIWIGFVVQSTITSALRYEYILIPVKPAPTPSFTLQGASDLNFCLDEPAVNLIGVPANSDNAFDNFTETGPGNPITSTPGPGVVWSFNPAPVGGAATFDIVYTYRDPVTGCTGTSAPLTVTVNPRPSGVTSGLITKNVGTGTSTLIELCQGSSAGSFGTNTPLTTPNQYTWYSSDQTTIVGTGNTFTPPVDYTIAGANTFYVTRTINGCESNKGPIPTIPLSLNVNVISTPPPPATNRDLDYCVGESIDSNDLLITTATGTVRWYLAGNPTHIFQGTNPTSTNLGINTSIPGIYNFELTQIESVNNCEGPLPADRTKIRVEIKSLPQITITPDIPDVDKICTTGGIVNFKAADQGNTAPNGTWQGTGLGGVGILNPFNLEGRTELNPVTLAPGTYTLEYEYEDAVTQCENTGAIDFTILPTINVAISLSDACLGSSIQITNNSTVNGIGSIDSVLWNFNDNSGLPLGFYSTAINANDGRTTGTYGAPSHRYTSVGNYQVSGMMMTNDGCRYAIPAQGVLVSPLPSVDFSWRNACRDVTSGLSNTEFLAVEKSTPQLTIATYDWDFNLLDSLTYNTTSGSAANPTVPYNTNGKDSVRLIATTTAGCQDSVKKPVYIVPTYLKIMGDTSYNQDFNATNDFWIAGGTNSSWQWDTLAIKGIEESATRGRGWDTNDIAGGKNFNNPNEQSWVLSQCFNFSDAKRPVIALDIFSDSPFQVNGAVLQYNLTGNIENDNDWITLGDEDQGINWYDASGISNPPGNQSANDLGWTGNRSTTNQKYSSWVRAIHRLDVASLNGASNAVFRIAFAAGNSLSDGFAFDNVFIGERTRKVLVENFTNSGAIPVAVHNQDFIDSGTPAEAVKIQYHTPFPANDPVNSLNPAMHNSRTAFYGITESKTARIDGIVRQGDLNDLYEDRVLTPSPLKITINPVKVDEVVEIEVSVENISGQTLPTQGLHLFTTIVEQSITDPALLSTSGNEEFVFVAKEMLPSPTGLQIPENLDDGGIYVSPKIIWRKQNGNAIVVMVQTTDGNNKNVLQSEVFLNPPEPDVITGIEDLAEYINIYPNPANESFEIELPTKAENRLTINLIDPVGRATQQLYFEKGEQTKTVNTQNLAQGIYVVQIGSGKTGVVRKKVLVVH